MQADEGLQAFATFYASTSRLRRATASWEPREVTPKRILAPSKRRGFALDDAPCLLVIARACPDLFVSRPFQHLQEQRWRERVGDTVQVLSKRILLQRHEEDVDDGVAPVGASRQRPSSGSGT